MKKFYELKENFKIIQVGLNLSKKQWDEYCEEGVYGDDFISFNFDFIDVIDFTKSLDSREDFGSGLDCLEKACNTYGEDNIKWFCEMAFKKSKNEKYENHRN